MKKFMRGLAVSILATSLLSGCGPQESDKKEESTNGTGDLTKPEKLVVWEENGKGFALEPAIKSFEEKYDIKIEYKEVEMSGEMKDKLRLDGPAGIGPDVLSLPHDQIGQLAIEGLITPIEVKQDVIDKFTETSIEALIYDGKLYGLPKATETPIFVYNKSLMNKAPATMEDLYQFTKDYGKEKEYGFLAIWDNFYFAQAVLGGMGGYIFNEGSVEDIGLNNEGAVEGAEYIQKWYAEGLFPKGIIGENGGSTLDSLFSEGKAASVMSGQWSIQSFKDAGIAVGVATLPKLPNGEPMKTFVSVKGWNVSNYSTNKEWSTKLVDFLTNYENAKNRYEKTGEVPPIRKLIEDPVITENEEAKAVALQSQYGVPMPNIPEMGEIWSPMATALQLIANGKEEPKKALNEAVKTIRTNIEVNHGN